MSDRPRKESPRLPRYAAVAYCLLIVYASLYPFRGWRDTGAPTLAFLGAAWPHYFTVFDLVTNVAVYVPFGFFLAAVLRSYQPRWLAVLLAALCGVLLSGSMETVQNYLPSRVPSNVDLACNALGGMLGAFEGVRRAHTFLDGGRLNAMRQRWIVADAPGDAGLVLLGLWLLLQLNPEILLFGSGDLRHWLGLEEVLPFDTQRFSRIETMIAAANTLAAGLIASCVLKRRRWQGVLTLLVAALLIHTVAAAAILAPEQALRWITPGNALGLLLGGVLLLPTLTLLPALRRAVAGSALLLATVLVNLAPENPYLAAAAQVWRHGHFLNFNGLTRLASILWPFLALPWLLLPQRDPWQAKPKP